MKQSVLVVSPEAPFPALGGGAQRIASLIHYFAQHGWQVDLLTFQNCEAPANLVRRHFQIPLPPNGRSMPARVLRNTSRLVRGVPPLIDRLSGFHEPIRAALGDAHYDLALLEHFWIAPYVQDFRKFAERVVCDLHNVESGFFASLGQSENGPLGMARRAVHNRFAKLCRNLEVELLPQFDEVLVTSDADAKRVCGAGARQQVRVYPNAIPWIEPRIEAKTESLVFSGNLEYHPNQQAVAWFAKQIWPILRQRFPNLEWRLVGMHPEAVAQVVEGEPRIRLVGPVDDAIAEIARARVSVVPLLSGSGTRIKILEAWAAGTPVVSTPIGAEGLQVDGESYLYLASEPEAFATAISNLLEEPGKARDLAQRARLRYEENYHWKAAWEHLDAAGLRERQRT